MVHLDLRSLTKTFGEVTAARDVSLSVDKGEFVSLLGPSGCGKTTTLHMIAGFLKPDQGAILVNGERINDVPPHKRTTAMVFQSYALFPHFTVEGNIEFGLKMRKVKKEERRARVQEALALVKLPDVRHRYPAELSGGQQQRIALARALVIKPEILLLDEPLSNLDARLRDEMRAELKDLLAKVNITTIFVTHDIVEAFYLSDRVAVMNRAQIVQVGSAAELYERPASEFVAEFLGPVNAFETTMIEQGPDRIRVKAASGHVLEVKPPKGWGASVGSKLRVMVRPESVRVSRTDVEGPNVLTGTVAKKIYLGSVVHLYTDIGQKTLLAYVPNSAVRDLERGDRVVVGWDGEDVIVSGGLDPTA